jgi:predicted MFS family arabinose efflux permease
MAYQGMLPMFVSIDLGAGGSAYGVLLTAIGLGAVLGSLALARVTDPRHRSALFVASLVGSGGCLTALGASSSLATAVVSGFLVGGTQAMFMSMTLAFIQASVDNQFRGRATSFYQMITLARWRYSDGVWAASPTSPNRDR